MPGPSNIKRKGKGHKKKNPRPSLESQITLQRSTSYESSTSQSPPSSTPPADHDAILPDLHAITLEEEETNHPTEPFVPPFPFIHDPGNGPRVRDTRAFLSSKFFAQPPAFDIPLCAEFAQEEILEMLCTILPEETALILWYNKSRATSRICPACQRLYCLGDILPDHVPDGAERVGKRPSPLLEREQNISGLCSPVCFVLASFNYPGAIQSAWGRMEDEMDDKTWELLNGPGEGSVQNDVGRSLGMLVKMTRLHDLGLAQLCLGEEDFMADNTQYNDEFHTSLPDVVS
ncbi:hypothetical protein BDZ94DRAFT_1259104 [Collybia nuda]|uniref:Uncharacterized protein n=1 Tax=Collybia nuda TaxID=64659 RepID=A0A9P5Y7T4_9AGAR|nr:hypothetical protein BDZ94DRAFT_1259104 [Collybia nuda]